MCDTHPELGGLEDEAKWTTSPRASGGFPRGLSSAAGRPTEGGSEWRDQQEVNGSPRFNFVVSKLMKKNIDINMHINTKRLGFKSDNGKSRLLII